MIDDIYTDPILELARKRIGHGRLADPRASVVLDNPLCGDRIRLDMDWRDDGKISGVAHEVRGCVLCRAAASALATVAPGRGKAQLVGIVRELEQILTGVSHDGDRRYSELAAFEAVCGHKSRFDCVLLPFKALLNGLSNRR